MRPLAGKRVLVTRPAEQATELIRGLKALGAEVVHLPTIRILPPLDAGLDRSLQQLDRYAWVAFTSANAVRSVFDRVPPERLFSVRVAVVGARTAEAMLAYGFRPELIAEPATSEVLVEQLLARAPLRGQWVLFPRGDRARDTLSARLKAAGAHVDDPVAYRTLPSDEATRDALRCALQDGGLDWITLTSPSTWHELQAVAGAGGVPRAIKLAVIGPTTAQAVRESGHAVACEAVPHDVCGLLAALAEHAATRS